MSFPQDLPHPSSSLAMTTARNQKSFRPDPPTPIRIIQTVSKGNKHSSTTCSYTQSAWDGKQRHRWEGTKEKSTSKDCLSCQRRIIVSPSEMANRHFRSLSLCVSRMHIAQFYLKHTLRRSVLRGTLFLVPIKLSRVCRTAHCLIKAFWRNHKTWLSVFVALE